MDKILSVGITVYNIKEEYLRACIESVTCSKSELIEIIIIDDCSTDGSNDICREYAKKDCRIKFFEHNKNRGVSAARNTIIDKAEGKWLVFLDGDDLMCNGFSELLIGNKDLEADLIYYGYEIMIDDRYFSPKSSSAVPIALEAEEVRDLCVKHLCGIATSVNGINLPVGIISKVFRRSFLLDNGLKFIEGVQISEDRLLVMNTLMSGARTYYSEQAICVYRRNSQSVTNRFNADILSVTDKYLKCSEKLIDKYFAHEEAVLKMYISSYVPVAVLDNFKLKIFHKDNSASYSKRKQDFLNLLQTEPYRTGIEANNFKNLLCEQRVLLGYAGKRRFFMLNILYRHHFLLRCLSSLLNKREKLEKRVFGKQ